MISGPQPAPKVQSDVTYSEIAFQSSKLFILCLCYFICHFIANNKTNKCLSQRELKEMVT